MSGGHFNYADNVAKNEIFHWSDKPHNVFEDREISELIWDVFKLIHDFDWYYSGDTDEETYLKAKYAFKRKWLNNKGVRVKHVIDKALNDVKEELYKTYGFLIEEGEET